ncbi:MAG: carboxypeptidase-like regulatory domain-containing protein [Sulfurimonadaceae bacterium]
MRHTNVDSKVTNLSKIMALVLFVVLLSGHVNLVKAAFPGTVLGQITDAETGDGIPDCEITIDLGDSTLVSSTYVDENYQMSVLPGGPYTLTVKCTYYVQQQITFEIRAVEFLLRNFEMEKVPGPSKINYLKSKEAEKLIQEKAAPTVGGLRREPEAIEGTEQPIIPHVKRQSELKPIEPYRGITPEKRFIKPTVEPLKSESEAIQKTQRIIIPPVKRKSERRSVRELVDPETKLQKSEPKPVLEQATPKTKDRKSELKGIERTYEE